MGMGMNTGEGASDGAKRGGASAFSLLELLVVLFIIALVVSILFPVLGGARESARRAATLSQIQNLTQASKQFELDNRRLPGYFAPNVMGANANVMRGFTQMQNIMLDLAGGITSAAPDGVAVIDDVGPQTAATNNVTVDIGQIGAPTGKGGTSSKSYYAPDRSSLIVQDKTGQVVASASNVKLPHVVDAFGTPLLAWAQDETVTINKDNFAAVDTGTTINGPYAFYWAQNAGILSADVVGKKARSQKFGANIAYSLLGAGRPSATTAIPETMVGIFGHPSYPLPNITPERPSSALGKVIFHSAGSDGYFLGTEERGGKLANGATSKAPKYGANVDNKVDFDDLIIGAGN